MNEPKPILIITGSAPCVMEDIDALGHGDRFEICPHGHGDWMAVGLDAVDKYAWPIKYVVTYHPVEIPQFKPKRAKIGGNTDFLVIAHKPEPGVDIVEPYESPTGSSALCGAMAAIRMGYERIILCGCPLLDKNYITFQKGWEKKKEIVKDKVRSMSGWTKDFLGAPTKEWLDA